jgi:hypothetical protein
MRKTLVVLLLGLAGCARDDSAHEEALRRCRQQAEECGAALVAKDFEKFADLTYPPVVETMGGRENMVALSRKRAQEARFEILSLKVEAPERLIIAGTDVLAVVPITRATLDAGKKMSGRSFFLGVSSDQGKSWTFLDGSNLDSRTLKQVLPHFPAGLKLP